MQFPSVYERDRLERRAERAEAGLDRPHALRPVGALANAEPRLDAVVVRAEVGRAERRSARRDEPARLVPLREVLGVRAQRDLRVDRGASRRRSGRRPARPRRRRRRRSGANRIGHQRSCAALASQRVKSAAVLWGPELEQEHTAAAVGQLAGDDSTAGARADDHDIEALAHPIPRYDQSFASRVACGRVEVDLLPRARGRRRPARRSRCRTPRSRAPARCRNSGVRTRSPSSPSAQDANCAITAAAGGLVHPGEQRVDVDGRAAHAPSRGRSCRTPHRPCSAVSTSSTCKLGSATER